MPEKKTIARAKRSGKAPSTQAGAFVHEEIEHVREGKHGARSAKQAIAIGLSKARRAGVKLPPPKKGTATKKTRQRAASDLRRGESATRKTATSARRARASAKALQREGHRAASRASLAKQARTSAKKRSPAARSAAAKKAARTRKAARRK